LLSRYKKGQKKFVADCYYKIMRLAKARPYTNIEIDTLLSRYKKGQKKFVADCYYKIMRLAKARPYTNIEIDIPTSHHFPVAARSKA